MEKRLFWNRSCELSAIHSYVLYSSIALILVRKQDIEAEFQCMIKEKCLCVNILQQICSGNDADEQEENINSFYTSLSVNLEKISTICFPE